MAKDSKRSLVRFATPYLEVEAQSISSREEEEAEKGVGQRSSIPNQVVAETRGGAIGGV